MKKSLTELVFVLDKSGSMWNLAEDTIGGFNSMLSEQRGKEGEVLVSTVLFNDTTQVIHDRVNIDSIKPMTRQDYVPGGSTALLDAVGGAIKHIGIVHRYARKEDVPEHTLFVIMTDGYENASRRYSYGDVKKMLEEYKNKYGWEFIFMAANIDTREVGDKLGIDEEYAVSYKPTGSGVSRSYDCLSEAVFNVRNNKRAWNGEMKRKAEKQ